MKALPMTLSAAVALAVAQLAAAQPSVIAPHSGNTSIEQNGVQNSNQVGSGNRSTQTYGNDNQQNREYGERHRSASAGASARGDDEHHDRGKHKGWYQNKNKHRDRGDNDSQGENRD